MSKFSEKFLFLNSFVNGFKDFDNYFTQNDEKIDSPEYNELFKKLFIMQSFLVAIEKMNKEQTEFLAEKIEKDEDIFKKKLVEMLNENNSSKNTWMFDRYSNTLTQFTDDNDNFKLVSSDSDDDNSSISSLDDINSQDSESDDKGNEEEQQENELVNKMFSKSLVEFNMRKETKDLRADKVE